VDRALRLTGRVNSASFSRECLLLATGTLTHFANAERRAHKGLSVGPVAQLAMSSRYAMPHVTPAAVSMRKAPMESELVAEQAFYLISAT
jgi:hypothetical protein